MTATVPHGDRLARALTEAGERIGGARRDRPAARVVTRRAVDVKTLRERHGLTQQQFADRFGIALGTLRNWEQGRRTPDGPAQLLLELIEARPAIAAEVLADPADPSPFAPSLRAASDAAAPAWLSGLETVAFQAKAPPAMALHRRFRAHAWLSGGAGPVAGAAMRLLTMPGDLPCIIEPAMAEDAEGASMLVVTLATPAPLGEATPFSLVRDDAVVGQGVVRAILD